MKRAGILHPQLAALVASMGHGDRVCVADAGLPVPQGVERIDLAFAPGRPGCVEVVHAVLTELHVEAYTLARESREYCPAMVAALAEALPEAEVIWIEHDELRPLIASVRGVVRTGEFTPYANVLLHGGVAFSPPALPE